MTMVTLSYNAENPMGLLRYTAKTIMKINSEIRSIGIRGPIVCDKGTE
jgi:hypothetical protein